MLTTLRSFRTTHFDELIRISSPRAELRATIEVSGLSNESRIVLSQNDHRVSKEISLNGKLMRASSQYLHARFGNLDCGFHSIVFNPADHDLIRGEPSGRRSFLDRVLAAESAEYFTSLTRFKRALENRNALLRQGAPPNHLTDFTEIFVSEGVELTRARAAWLEKVNPLLREHAARIAPGTPDFQLVPQSRWNAETPEFTEELSSFPEAILAGQGDRGSIAFLKKRLYRRLEETRVGEREAKTTLVGPHRDDWQFRFGENVLKAVGSQGEVRTALLALKLSEIELFRRKTGGDPLLLLDDFSSELDQARRKALLQFLAETPLQVFVTSTELPMDLSFGRVFAVRDGNFEMGSGERG